MNLTKKILLSIVAILSCSFIVSSCVPVPRKVAVVSDSMGYYDQSVIIAQIEANGDDVVHFSSIPGTTTWNNANLITQIKSPNNTVIVVTFGLNETRYIRGDVDAVPSKTLTQVLSSWTYVKNLAQQYNKCLVWTTTQTAYPLNTSPTVNIISSLNNWIRNNVLEAAWEPTVNYNVQYQNSSWLRPDGFHLLSNSWGPNAFGIKIREAINSGC